jgi:FkbM family methyltransferase
MDYSKLVPVRNFLRAIGVTSLLTLPSRLKSRAQIKEYEKNKPQSLEVELEGKRIKMHTESAFEWMRVQSFYNDKHIIKAIAERLDEKSHFWDIGTSIGLYSNMIAKFVPNGKVVSFEPEIRSRARLNENITLNKNNNVKVCPVALGDKKGKLYLALADKASAGTHRVVETAEGNVQEIDIYSADAYRSQENLSVPNAIKIDVEGQEEKVVLGAKNTLSNKNCHTVIIEVHFAILASNNDKGAPERITEHLKQAGFNKVGWLDSSHLIATK